VKSILSKDRIDSFKTIYRDHLLEDVLPFWEKHSPDPEHGGFLFELDRDGSVYGTTKPVWIHGRYTWLTARLYNEIEPRPEWLKLAKEGAKFLKKHAFDTDGRMFFTLTREGRPLRKRRYIFSETFAAIAFAELARATGDEDLARESIELFKLIDRYLTTPGMLEPKLRPEAPKIKAISVPMTLLKTVQILRKISDDPILQTVADRSLHELEHHFMKPELEAMLERVGPEGEFIDSPEGRALNSGNSIEAAWFILEESRYRNDPHLQKIGLQILDWSLARGWDREFGGFTYILDLHGKPSPHLEHELKLWWPHNEAIYATLLAAKLTGDKRYLKWHRKIHDWSFGRFPDPDHGEWFGYLRRDGTVANRLKGNLWKGPFHLPRMLLNCWQLLEEQPNLCKPSKLQVS